MANEFVARKGLIVSGSTNISGSVTASYFKGDGSQLTNLPSTNISSVVINNSSFVGDGTTNTFNLGASYTPNSLMVSVDGLFYTPTADFTVSGNNIVFTSAPPSASDITIRAMTNVVSGAVGTYSGSFTGTFTGTGSWANNAISASYVDASGLPSGTVSSSAQITYTQLQNIPVGIVSSSAQVKELLPTNTVSSSAQVTAFLPNGTVSSSTQINTGSFTGSFVGSLLGTSSWANNAVTASYVDYTNIDNKPILVSASSQISYTGLSNIPTDIVSSSAQVTAFLPNGTVSSSAQYPGWVTASSQIDITATTGYSTFSSSIATKNNEQDAAIASLVGVTGSYATTGSNIFNADQTITGSLYITQNLIVQGSSSISYVSQSTLNVGTNVITVNVQNPSVRFGGLSVIDSGSSPQLSGSLFFDSINDQWIFIHQHVAGASTTSSVLLMGPQTYDNIGNETNLTTNRLPKSVNAEHLGDSQITDDGSIVSITNALSVGTSITASQADITTLRATSITSSVSGALTGTFPYASLTGIPSDIVSSSAQVTSLLPAGTVSSSTQINTGSLQGTASYATNADLFDGKDSTTFATTGSNTFTATQTIAGNLFLSASFPLVYNNNSANNMLFGLFDGSTIHGAYYQTFGNTYPSLSQRGGAEFVYDVRNNSDANFHVASFNGSTWTEKFRVDDTGIIVTGSIKSTGGVTGSLYGTSSWAENAITSSYALNAGAGAGFPFSGSAVITGSLLVSSSGIQTVGGGFTGSLLGTSSAANSAVSSSYALTASFAMNGGGGGGAGFPFVGDAVITGSLYVSGSNISGSFKGDGSQLTGIDIATAVVSDIYKFVGNGSTQLYVLSQSYFTNNVQVSVDGLVQTEGVDYTYTTGSISFVLAPPSSSNVLVTALLNTQNNLSGSFSGSFIGDGRGINNIPLAINIDTYKYSGDGATTDYALNYPYGPNSLFVSVNGVTFVNPDDFILTGSTISFTEVPASASNILIRAFVTQSVINSASFALTASYVEYANIVNKPTLVSASSQIDVRNTTGIQTIATTGSNTFVGNQIISGSINFQSGSSIFPNLQNLEIKPGVGGELLLLNSDSSHYVSIDAPGITITDLTVLNGVTGSLQGTSSWATNAITASFALNAQSGGSGAGFPFSGSAVITGSLRVVPTGSVGGITGSFSGSGAGLHDLRSSLALDTYNFIGDGTTINYVLSQSYTPNSLFVSVEGINYTYIEDFTLSSNTLTFVVAPPTQSNVSVRALLSVSSGSYINYTGSFIGDGYGLDNLRGALAIETNKFIGDGVTTQYTLSSSYSPQSMLVTVGGLRYIDTNDYSLTGSTLNFVQAPASQSVIVAQAYLIISSGSVGTFSGSFLGNATTATSASYATTASFASNVLKTKAGSITSASFGGTPLSASVTFSTAFDNTNYSVAVTGEDARIFTIESKTASGFVVNTNSNTALTGTTYWTCTAYGEN